MIGDSGSNISKLIDRLKAGEITPTKQGQAYGPVGRAVVIQFLEDYQAMQGPKASEAQALEALAARFTPEAQGPKERIQLIATQALSPPPEATPAEQAAPVTSGSLYAQAEAAYAAGDHAQIEQAAAQLLEGNSSNFDLLQLLLDQYDLSPFSCAVLKLVAVEKPDLVKVASLYDSVDDNALPDLLRAIGQIAPNEAMEAALDLLEEGRLDEATAKQICTGLLDHPAVSGEACTWFTEEFEASETLDKKAQRMASGGNLGIIEYLIEASQDEIEASSQPRLTTRALVSILGTSKFTDEQALSALSERSGMVLRSCARMFGLQESPNLAEHLITLAKRPENYAHCLHLTKNAWPQLTSEQRAELCTEILKGGRGTEILTRMLKRGTLPLSPEEQAMLLKLTCEQAPTWARSNLKLFSEVPRPQFFEALEQLIMDRAGATLVAMEQLEPFAPEDALRLFALLLGVEAASPGRIAACIPGFEGVGELAALCEALDGVTQAELTNKERLARSRAATQTFHQCAATLCPGVDFARLIKSSKGDLETHLQLMKTTLGILAAAQLHGAPSDLQELLEPIFAHPDPRTRQHMIQDLGFMLATDPESFAQMSARAGELSLGQRLCYAQLRTATQGDAARFEALLANVPSDLQADALNQLSTILYAINHSGMEREGALTWLSVALDSPDEARAMYTLLQLNDPENLDLSRTDLCQMVNETARELIPLDAERPLGASQQDYVGSPFWRSRNPGALLLYAGGLGKQYPAERKMVGKFFAAVTLGTFPGDRYLLAGNPHLEKMFSHSPQTRAMWKASSSYTRADRPEAAPVRGLLTELAKEPLDSLDLEELTTYIADLPNKETNKEARALSRDTSLMGVLKRASLGTKAIKGKRTNLERLKGHASKLDAPSQARLQPLIDQLESELLDLEIVRCLGPGEEAVETDDFMDCLLSGTETESCQSVDGDVSNNCCLQAYLMDGKNRLLGVHGSDGRLKARAMLRLMDSDGGPVLLLETVYPASAKQNHGKALEMMAIKKARALGIPLCGPTSQLRPQADLQPLPSLADFTVGCGQGPCPSEYADHGGMGVETMEWDVEEPLFWLHQWLA